MINSVATIDYGDHADRVSPGDNILTKISDAAYRLVEKESRVEMLEAKLKAAKAEVREIQEVELPELMDQAETSDLKTKDGLQVKVSQKVRGNIKSQHAEAAFKWLEANGHSGLMAANMIVDVGSMDLVALTELQNKLTDKHKLSSKLKRDIHWATLSAFLTEELGAGRPVPMDIFGVFTQRKAHVRVKV